VAPEFAAPFGSIMRLRTYFLTGLVVLAPTVITGWLVWKLFITVDNVIEPLREKFPLLENIPGLGVVVVVLLIFIVGFLASNLVGRRLISAGEKLLNRLPLVRRIYTASKELSQVFLTDKKTVFKRVVLIRFPQRETFAMAFVMNEDTRTLEGLLGGEVVTVFVPTTPNPTSGFMLVVGKADTVPLGVSVEEALKMVISGGAFMPHQLSELPVVRE
jgi:uncharacterized membrane protein